MTQERMAEIRAREAAATPGPWRQGNVERFNVFVPHAGGLGPERVLLRMNQHFDHGDDAAFIAAAREDVPWLLGEVARLEEWSGANRERGAWSKAWALLTGSSEYGVHSDAAIVRAAEAMKVRAEKAEDEAQESTRLAEYARTNYQRRNREAQALEVDVERLGAELDAATTRGRELVQEAELAAHNAETEVARLTALLGAATYFEFGEYVALRILPAEHSEGRGEIWRVRRGYFDALPLEDDPQRRLDLSRDEAIDVARRLDAQARGAA